MSSGKRKQLEKIIEAAIWVFSSRGYRQAKMSHIARQANIAPGTLYLYFESKESLFNFLVKHIFTNGQELDAVSIPIKSSTWDSEFASTKNAFVSKLFSVLHDAAHREVVNDIHEEFENIIRDLFSTMATYRHGITILLQSSLNWPKLADFYVGIVRDLLQLISAYLEKRIRLGLIREVPSVSLSARFILEIIGWFAVHRHQAVHQVAFSPKTAEETVVDLLVHAFIPEHLQE